VDFCSSHKQADTVHGLTITATLTKKVLSSTTHNSIAVHNFCISFWLDTVSNLKYIFMGILRLLLLLSLVTHGSLLQGQDTTNKKVSFATNIDIKQATKDGIYLNGYVVNIPYDKLTELNGKTVRISGKVTIVKGLKHYTDGEIRQGRQEDTKHILKPKIKIVDDLRQK
jgi:hypothetical protein